MAGISKGPEAGLLWVSEKARKKAILRGVEGGWWVEAVSQRPQAHGHDKEDGLALWMGSSELIGQRAVCSGLVIFQACFMQCGEWL